ncbi:MAG: heavy-metal-associated domain-containing protein [Acidobacteria bacterium]|nr:heavy-metal-associated domain-containing protein [Acidobacteriota bacterium]
MEIALRRLEGVEKVSISIENQTFEVSYKPGTSFRPGDLREAVAQASVGVVRFYIQARGTVREETGKRFFLAGNDKFPLVDAGRLPLDTPLSIVATVDDSTELLQLNVRDFKPLPKETAR